MPEGQPIDDIIAKFENEARRDSILRENPAAIAVISSQLRSLAGAQQPGDAAQQAYDLVMDHADKPAIGKAVCGALLAREGDGKQIACEVAQQAVQSRLQQVGSAAEGGFVRSGESINGFSKEFMEQTSPNMASDVTQQVAAVSAEVQAEIVAYTNKVQPYKDELNRIQPMINQLADGSGTPEEKEARKQEFDRLVQQKEELEANIALHAPEHDAIQIKVAKLHHGLLTQLPLSEESKSYLNGLRNAVKTTPGFKESYMNQVPGADEARADLALDKIGDNLVNNNTSLRVTAPLIVSDPQLRSNPLWKDSAQSGLASFNRYRDDTLNTSEKMSREVADGVHTPEIRENTAEMHNMIASAPLPVSLNLDLATPHVENAEQRQAEFEQDVAEMKEQLAQQALATNQPQVDAPAKRRSVREMLTAAKETVQKKLGLTTDQKIADKATKQAEKREARVGRLNEVLEEKQAELAKHPQKNATLKDYKPLSGDPNQGDIADSLKLQGEIAKLEKMIDKNEKKIPVLKTKAEKFQAKADLKASLHQGHEQGASSGVKHGHN